MFKKREKIPCDWKREYDEVILKTTIKGQMQFIPLLKYSGKDK